MDFSTIVRRFRPAGIGLRKPATAALVSFTELVLRSIPAQVAVVSFAIGSSRRVPIQFVSSLLVRPIRTNRRAVVFRNKELINSSHKFNAISFKFGEQTYNNPQLKVLVLVAHLRIRNSRPQIALRQRINLWYPDLLKEANFVSNRRELTNRQQVLH